MTDSGREALEDYRVCSRRPPGWSGSPPDVRERSAGYQGCPGVVGRPSRMLGCGREALQDGRETLLNVRE